LHHGGGEGATVRELLKHQTVERINHVDIAGTSSNFCKKHLQPWHNPLKTSGFHLIVENAIRGGDHGEFDIIIWTFHRRSKKGAYLPLHHRILQGPQTVLRSDGNFVMQRAPATCFKSN